MVRKRDIRRKPASPGQIRLSRCDTGTFILFNAAVERPYDLTHAGLREIIAADGVTFIHWRWEGIGDNETGDRYFCDTIREFGTDFARILQIEGAEYRFKMRGIKEVLNEVSPDDAHNIHELPNYSIVGYGGEARIEGAV